MDRGRESLWTRRSNSNKGSSSSFASENGDTKHDNPSRRFTPSKQPQDPSTPNRSNGLPPINTNNSSGTPGAKSAFGLGSGAFASFGSASKTPKTPGIADFTHHAPATAVPITGSDKKEKEHAKFANFKAQTPSKEQVSDDVDLKSVWPLKYAWVMWYRPPTSKNSDYEKSIRPIYRMSTAQEFWMIFTHLKRPSELPTVSDYHFFKDSIRPVWEDEQNKKGGKWIMRLKKGVVDRYWEDIMLAVIGDQFAEAGEEVCGMVVSVRGGEDVVSVWTRIDGGRNIKIRETIKRVLNLPSDTIIIWKSHDDSIAQKSAIEQARQDKDTPEKRRSTINNNEYASPSRETAAAT